MLGTAVGCEINRVAVPHRKRIGVFRVRYLLLENIVLDVVDVNVLGQAARITLPRTEVAEYAVVGDLRSVGGERSQAALIHGQRLGKAAINAHAVGALDPSVSGVAAGEKHNPLTVWKPSHDLIVNSHAVAERLCCSLIESQLFRLAALRRH